MSHYLVYVRQSYRLDDDADVSEEQQEAAARRLLPKGATHEVIRDTGGHRSGRTENRDGYRLLIARMAEGDVTGISVYDLSRLARNARLMLNLKHELDARNLHLIVSNLPDSRFDTAVGRFLFGQLCLAAQFQADLDSERMVAITRTKHESGGHNGSDPYGYRTARTPEGKVEQPHRLAPVPEEADVVRLIFDGYGSGDFGSHKAIAMHLNEQGIRRRGKPWAERGVTDVIRRAPFYCGYAVYRRGQDVRPGAHDPIITPEQRHLAERAALRRRSPGRHVNAHRPYPLRRLAHCGCGRRMRGETLVRPGRVEYRYYRCPGRREGTCAEPNMRADVAERAVIDHLAGHTSPPELIALARAELRKMRHLPDEGLTVQRERLQAALRRVNEMYMWQTIEEPEYRAKRAELEGKLSELPPPSDSNIVAFDRAASELVPLAETLRHAAPEHQARLIAHIVERVTVAAGEVAEVRVRMEARPFFADMAMAPPERFELPTQALGRPRSIH